MAVGLQSLSRLCEYRLEKVGVSIQHVQLLAEECIPLCKRLCTLQDSEAVAPHVVQRVKRVFYVQRIDAVPFVTVNVQTPATNAHTHAPRVENTPAAERTHDMTRSANDSYQKKKSHLLARRLVAFR